MKNVLFAVLFLTDLYVLGAMVASRFRSNEVWIEWVEPFGPNNEPVYCQIPRSTAILVQKKIAADKGKPYAHDEDAFQDFVTVHWANVL